MTVLASVIIGKAQNVLNDAGATRWTAAELLDWLNDAQRQIATEAPDASSKIADFATVAGTRQTCPADLIELIKVVRNTGAAGSTPGEAPRRTKAELLDMQRPNWHSDTATAVVKNWVFDPRVPSVFWVYPPMTGVTHLDIAYSFVPTPCATAGTAVSIPDEYQNAILEYICFRAFSKDTEIAAMQARASAHLAEYNRILGTGEKADEEATA